MSAPTDAIDAYLDELLLRLRGPVDSVRRTLVEAEAHLRDTVDRDVAAGVATSEAQRRAIASFGSAREVAMAANRAVVGASIVQLAGALSGAAVRMVAIGLAAIGLAAIGARILASITSNSFVFGVPAGTPLPAASCAHWLSVQPVASSCAQAAMLENADDTFLLYTGFAVIGLLLIGLGFGIAFLIRRFGGHGRPRTRVPSGVVPAIGATIFGGTGLALLSAGLSDTTFPGAWGQGLWLVEAAVALIVATGYSVALVRSLIFEPLIARFP